MNSSFYSDTIDCFLSPPMEHPSMTIGFCNKSTQTSTRRRTVSFCPTSQVIILQPPTASDIRESWYTKDDLDSFNHANKETAKRIRTTRTARQLMKRVTNAISSFDDTPIDELDMTMNHIEPDHYFYHAIHGIEHMICPLICSMLLKRRNLVIRSVLDEQHNLSFEDDDNTRVIKIAQVSSMNSRFNVEWNRRVLSLHH